MVSKSVQALLLELTLSFQSYMFKYDSTHGRFKGSVEVKENKLVIEGHSITVFSERAPENIKWSSVGAEYIIESTVSSAIAVEDFLSLCAHLGCLHHYRCVSLVSLVVLFVSCHRQCGEAHYLRRRQKGHHLRTF